MRKNEQVELIDGTCGNCGMSGWMYKTEAGIKCHKCKFEQLLLFVDKPKSHERCVFPGCNASLRGKRKGAKYCSVSCRQKHNRAKKSGHTHYCENCGYEFDSRRSDAFACSSKCRQALYRQRKQKQVSAESNADREYFEKYVEVVRVSD